MCKIHPVIPLFTLDEIFKSFTFNTTWTATKLLHKWQGPGDQLYFMSEMTNKSFIPQVMYLMVSFSIWLFDQKHWLPCCFQCCTENLLHVVCLMSFFSFALYTPRLHVNGAALNPSLSITLGCLKKLSTKSHVQLVNWWLTMACDNLYKKRASLSLLEDLV